MIWAQLAWGSYWFWDPKETMTLLRVLSLSASLVAYYEKRPKLAKALPILTCVLVPLTASTSWIIEGLHSFA
jgi:ABC-type transport system involved in cytochrome c biogenesis permease subunit